MLLTSEEIYLFNEGNYFRLYEKLGAHPATVNEVDGTWFMVWAPDAERVAVMGSFNDWNNARDWMQPVESSGAWELFIPGVRAGALYKYRIYSKFNGYQVDKADPVAFYAEPPPKTASIVWPLDYPWRDQEWMKGRRHVNALDAPMSIYEVHLGSWMRVPDGNGFLSYRDSAQKLAAHCKKLGFTHVELMPVMEHPLYASWGYQVTGYFAPTSRYGTPQEFMYFVDCLHQNGIGVILDWVPAHFPTDDYALGLFDGTHLYEHSDPKKGFHPDWRSHIFNYGRYEVRSFLISNALFWFDKYHIDGLRLDAVASMLYLDYSRKEGEWIPNAYGGRDNWEAITFLRRLNEEVYKNYPDVQMIAEESTAWPMVTRPTYIGGLGFGLKWDMGWMHDMLSYMCKEPIHRKYHHNLLTFRMLYACHENFVLSLSHDEVVHGKGSLLAKMPGDIWQKFANLRLLYAYMYGQTGKKLLFMGGEFGQWDEWYHEKSLDWHLLEYPTHAGIERWVSDLNRFYRSEPALYELDYDPAGFSWIDCNDTDQSVISFIRKGRSTSATVLAVFNLTPIPRYSHRIGVPFGGRWKEVLNSDSKEYGGSGLGNLGGVEALGEGFHGRPNSVSLTLPPLSALFFKGSK